MQKLFCVHDLNHNGLLEENELVWLNEKIAILHCGHSVDLTAVRAKYIALFRTKLDPDGHAVPYKIFRNYTLTCLDALDPHEQAQEMILEQFVAEADMVIRNFTLPPTFCSMDDLDILVDSTVVEEEEEIVTPSAACMLERHVSRERQIYSADKENTPPREKIWKTKPGITCGMLQQANVFSPDDVDPDEEACHQKPLVCFLSKSRLPRPSGQCAKVDM